MADWTAAMTVYNARLVAAGASLSPKITAIADAEPKELGKTALMAYWWGGRRQSTTGGNSLAKVNVEEALVTAIYVPETVRLPRQAGSIEDYLRAAVNAVHGQLWGGWSLGGNVIGISVDDTEAGWVTISGITARSATFTTWLDLEWVHDIVQ